VHRHSEFLQYDKFFRALCAQGTLSPSLRDFG
jgi:hypothetical protein